ncbi:MAG: 16S rRNA (guanine(966)-N(2))-methyltransferase RsmD [Flavobacteriales bacterium]|nr:16S rRNA (guanine(966)-N(2))-methyltransferase RsmD [Flavobacteriales bacterium]
MRIIGGKYKGKGIYAPKNLPVRPTTDFAKEGLFNVLRHTIEINGATVLDLFCGTGNMTYEFASRGAASVLSIDRNFNCIRFVRKSAGELKNDSIKPLKFDVFKFLDKCNIKFDIIFADPPYDLEEIPQIAQKVMSRQLLNGGGLCIVEHSKRTDMAEEIGFKKLKNYGNVNFSFFSE